MKTFRYIKPFFALILILCVAAPSPVMAQPAQSPHCFGSSCSGKDPQVYGCWRDAVTVARSPQPGTAGAGWLEVVEVRYSAMCGARWARVTSRLPKAKIHHTNAYLPEHLSTAVTKYGAAGAMVYSKMWWAVNPSGSACGNSLARNTAIFAKHCTP